MRTYSAKSSDIERRWYVVDAEGQPLGRLAARVASVLRGKHRPEYTPHADAGDFVVVVNASKIKLTGDKLDKKMWYRHLGQPGNLREIPYRQLLARRPEFAIEKAVRGMLPKNPLGRQVAKKLKVYADGKHPHAAQKPEPMSL